MKERGSAVLIEGKKVALIIRIKNSLTYFVFPGGGVENGETPEEATKREAYEELGVEIVVKDCIAEIDFNGKQFFFLGDIVGGTFGTGKGQEFKDGNIESYTPMWVDIDDLSSIDVKPKEVAYKVKGPRRGWEMPGGQVEEGESLKEAAIRETKEESGIDIEVTKFCGVFQNVSESICNILFLGTPIGGDPTTSPESLEVGFFPIEKALELVTWKNFRQRIEYCLNDKFHPFYVEF